MEIMDISIVRCDSDSADVEIQVWSPAGLKSVPVTWRRSGGGLRSTLATAEAVFVLASREVLDDVMELVAYCRDLRREMN